jgi:hypothetical protein
MKKKKNHFSSPKRREMAQDPRTPQRQMTYEEISALEAELNREKSRRLKPALRTQIKEIYDKHHIGTVEYRVVKVKGRYEASILCPENICDGILPLASGFGKTQEDAKEDAARNSIQRILSLLPETTEEEDFIGYVKDVVVDRPYIDWSDEELQETIADLSRQKYRLIRKDPLQELKEVYETRMGSSFS